MKKIIFVFLFCSPTFLFAQQQATTKSQKALVAVVPPPLYVLDGKILPAKEKTGVDSTRFINPIESIDPNTIDKVEVLNGALAIEKYGDAGKNGVVIITSKEPSSKPKKN